MSDVKRTEEPHDPLTEVGAKLLEAFEAMPEAKGLRVVLFIENDQRCATVLDGWNTDLDAMAAVFAHMAAVFEANGKKLIIAPLRQG
jgi:hypothetical protein